MYSTMRTRTSAKCFVRQYAVPVSPLCSVLSTFDQSVVPNEISAIFIVCAPRADRGALRVRSSAGPNAIVVPDGTIGLPPARVKREREAIAPGGPAA